MNILLVCGVLIPRDCQHLLFTEIEINFCTAIFVQLLPLDFRIFLLDLHCIVNVSKSN